jgi:hypothetical protein
MAQQEAMNLMEFMERCDTEEKCRERYNCSFESRWKSCDNMGKQQCRNEVIRHDKIE